MSEQLLMLVSLRIAPAQEAAFNDFYHHRYLPALLRNAPEIEAVWRYEEFGVTGSLRWFNKQYLTQYLLKPPAWAATRRYQSVDREPMRVHTVYEVESVAALDEAFGLMRAPHRFGSNADWDAWVGDAIRWQDATSFRPIYRAPG